MSDITSEASTRASADTNLQNQVNSLNSSVSNGKTQVANAITGKGVAASGSDSFATLASKISQISTVSSDMMSLINQIGIICPGQSTRYDYSDTFEIVSGPKTIYMSSNRQFTITTDFTYAHSNMYTSVCYYSYTWGIPVSIAMQPVYDKNTAFATFIINSANSNLPPVYNLDSTQLVDGKTYIYLTIGLSGSSYYWDSSLTDQSNKQLVIAPLGTVNVRASLDTYFSYSFRKT